MHSDIPHQRARYFLCAALIAAVIFSAAWRAHASSHSVIYLPLILNSVQQTVTPPDTRPEQVALDRLNFYRTLAHSPAMQLHPALVMAAQHHANYYLLNTNDASAWQYGPHGEVAGKPGYTGETSGDRAVAAGYSWRAGWEVMSYVDDPTSSVDGWMATIFHRTIILDPYLEYMGYGHGRSTLGQVGVVDLGHGSLDAIDRTQVIVFPAAGQTGVPTAWLGGEVPDPLPPGTIYPVGYPITVQPIAYVPLSVTQAELRDDRGAQVAVYPSPAGCGTACYAFVAVQPLQPATVYTVHVAGTLDGVPFDKTWTFMTTS
jgi:Cysteine-rich secretory protein family